MAQIPEFLNRNFNKEFEKYNSKEKVEAAWKQNEEHWNGEADKIKFQGNSDKFDGWLRWVSIQPVLRKIYGCSFLPYHDLLPGHFHKQKSLFCQ